MAAFNSLVNVAEAVETRSKFNLSHDCITTTDFNQINVVSIKELVPGDSFNLKINSFARLAPLPVPTYGRGEIVNRVFYVPMRLLMRGFNEVLTNTTIQGQGSILTPTIPYITNRSLVQAFAGSTRYMVTTTSDIFDWEIGSTRYSFTVLGRKLYSLLVSLGYQLNATTNDQTKMSLLPLFAYGRIYYDWYYPSQYQPTDPWRYFFEQSNISVTSQSLALEILDIVSVFGKLEKDYFTSAWLSPNSPIGERNISMQEYQFGSTNPGLPNTISNSDSSMSTYIQLTPNSQNPMRISQYGLDTLHAVDHYLRRNMLAGNRYIEQMLARYGKRVPDSWIQRSEYLGSISNPLMISDVTSTSDTQGATLGSYAGKGVAQVDGHFSVDSKEFGYLIVINQVIPKTGYVQGRRRETVFHLDKLDFFTPEFELLGTAPIRNDELFAQFTSSSDYTDSQSDGGKPDGIFGYQDRYSEYRHSFDTLTGDFIFPSLNSQMKSWHLYRNLDPSLDTLALNLAFMDGDPYTVSNNFNRIFQIPSSAADHFIMVHNIGITAYRPLHSSADTIVTEGGRYVELPRNGYQL